MEIQIHPAEMSQGENGSDEEALQRFTSTIVQKIGEGTQKTESFFSSASIYRVPEYLRKHKESAYTPCLIAIGPLHREDKHLQTPLQHVKMSYTNHLLSRLTIGMEDLVQECLAEMKTLVDDAKKCYAEEVTLDEEMMLVDGCFILEFLYGKCTGTEMGACGVDGGGVVGGQWCSGGGGSVAAACHEQRQWWQGIWGFDEVSFSREAVGILNLISGAVLGVYRRSLRLGGTGVYLTTGVVNVGVGVRWRWRYRR
ncbi:hypothetical protein RHGRI_038918 [Rhododendron griersonianum]|uniref:Uncharacterized protein n=1 Tax=Rhododendron griersonianum TaxID=479676 RepID=A0AAV6HIM4_9ERIC|nr:hypothetical protein RHGRI_038918 [Rhododendron griersonianum]